MNILMTACVFLALAFSTSVKSQAASSKSFFLTSSEIGPGGTCVSQGFRLTAGFGDGVVASRVVSKGYVLTGGFPATLDAKLALQPWLTGLRPLYAPLKGGTALTLHGTELALGANTGVQIGTKTAIVSARTRDTVKATMPVGLEPGWQSVTVTAGGQTSTLQRGIAVLPMLELVSAAEPLLPFTVQYRGAKGDVVVLLAGVTRLPFTVPVSPFQHGLELNPAAMLVLDPAVVSEPSGVLQTPLPALPWARPLLFQAITLSQNPGYSPGSFTNLISL